MIGLRELLSLAYPEERRRRSFFRRFLGPSLVALSVGLGTSLATKVVQTSGWLVLGESLLHGLYQVILVLGVVELRWVADAEASKKQSFWRMLLQPDFSRRLLGPGLVALSAGFCTSLAAKVGRTSGWLALGESFLYGVPLWIVAAILEHFILRDRPTGPGNQ